MIYPKFTFSEIINGSVIRNDAHREKVISFLRSFIKYLKTVKKLSDNSTKMYINRLLTKFLNNGFSLADLLGSLKEEICDYSPEGREYDKRDHNNTLSALKHLRAFYWQDKLPKYISISKFSGWQSFAANHSDHAIFLMENNKVLEPKKQKMRDYDFYCIQELIFDNYKYLSSSNNALTTFHGPVGYYNYVIGDSLYDMSAFRGNYCRELFFSKDTSDEGHVNKLNVRLADIIKKYF